MNLTESQQCAVLSDAQETLVIAGAGSGKTRVLVERIKHLLSEGASLADLLVLTFTRKSAAEMIERLAEFIEDREIRGMLIGTFHSIALRLLRADGDKLGYDPDTITIVDAEDADLLLMQVAKDLQYVRESKGRATWVGGLSFKRLKAFREAFYNTGEFPAGKDPRPEIVYREYRSRLFKLNALDFGLILIETKRLLSTHSEVLARWEDRIKHVIVDEVQDTDDIQYDLHEFFAPPATFFAVGDRRQCIYKFRGARPDLITDRHPGAVVIDLRECFRCDSTIVDAANALIEHNCDPLAKPMISQTGRAGTVERKCLSFGDLGTLISTLSPRWNGRYRDIAILARQHRTLRKLSEFLFASGVPFHRVGSGFDVCATSAFKELRAALRLCANPRDELAFLRLLGPLGLNTEAFAKLRAYAERESVSWLRVATSDAKNERLAQGLCGLAYTDNDHTIGTVIEGVADALWNGECHPEGSKGDWYANTVDFWLRHCETLSIPDAVRWVAFKDGQDDHRDGNHVTLCTVHAAKGLEWPFVIVADCEEGYMPSSQSKKSPEALEEERRVMYVAMTRAKQRLVLHYRTNTVNDEGDGRIRLRVPSRFLAEAGVWGRKPEEACV